MSWSRKARIYAAGLRRDRGHYKFFIETEPRHIKLIVQRLGLDNSLYFKRDISTYLSRNKGDVILDLSNLDELDASRVAVFVHAKSQLGEYQLVVTGEKEQPTRKLQMARLEKMFKPGYQPKRQPA